MAKLQVYARQDVLGDEAYAQYKTLDIGDIVGVAGEVFRTQCRRGFGKGGTNRPAEQILNAAARKVARAP